MYLPLKLWCNCGVGVPGQTLLAVLQSLHDTEFRAALLTALRKYSSSPRRWLGKLAHAC